MSRKVFDSRGQTIYDFGGEFLVRCPRCNECATVTSRSGVVFGPVRLLCAACGLVKDRNATQAAVREATDWYFGLPLWLQTPCRGRILWAYNQPHLEFLEAYVRADLRQETGAEGGPRNSTLASRLPAWIKSAKNREDVLRALARLRLSRS